jgi:hypothetical protein
MNTRSFQEEITRTCARHDYDPKRLIHPAPKEVGYSLIRMPFYKHATPNGAFELGRRATTEADAKAADGGEPGEGLKG